MLGRGPQRGAAIGWDRCARFCAFKFYNKSLLHMLCVFCFRYTVPLCCFVIGHWPLHAV